MSNPAKLKQGPMYDSLHHQARQCDEDEVHYEDVFSNSIKVQSYKPPSDV